MSTKPTQWRGDGRAWSPTGHLDPETLRKTVEACAWLIGIAEESAKSHGWNPGIVQWLEAMGSSAHEVLQRELQ